MNVAKSRWGNSASVIVLFGVFVAADRRLRRPEARRVRREVRKAGDELLEVLVAEAAVLEVALANADVEVPGADLVAHGVALRTTCKARRQLGGPCFRARFSANSGMSSSFGS